MATDWTSTLTRIAAAFGRGLLLLARHLLALLVAIGRFIALRALPAAWRWLRGTALPALRRFYLWLPHRRVVVAVGVAVIAIVGTTWMIQPSRSGPDPATTRDGKPIALSTREGRLVEQLMSGDWKSQKAATGSILRQMGFTVLEGTEMPGPDDTLYVIPPELVVLAIDGAQKPTTGRVTLAELAHMMRQFDFPFAPEQDPALLLRDGVRDWVRAALDDPKQDGAYAPLFLHAMAARQYPAIDLSSDDWSAPEYYLTHLELQVFFGAFYQALSVDQLRQASHADWLLSPFVGTAHASADPCTDLRNHITSFGEQNGMQDQATITNFLMQKLVGSLTGMAMDNMGKVGAIAKRVMIPINTLVKLQKLAMMYSSMEMSLTADQSFVHKPGRGEPGKELTFTVTVGVDEDKYAEHLEQWNSSPAVKGIKACLAYMGLPMPTDTADISGEVKDWRVKWELFGQHATYGTKKNEFESQNQRRMKLTPVGGGTTGTSAPGAPSSGPKPPAKAEASFIVDIRHEEGAHEGDQVTDFITGRATLDTEKAPVIDKFAEAGKGSAEGAKGGWRLLDILNVGNTAIDLLAGALQKFMDPVKYYRVEILDHRHRFADYSYRGTIRGHNSKYKTAPVPGWIAMYKLQGTSIETQTLSFNGDFTTARSSFTPDRQGAYWYMEGEGTRSATYDYFSNASVERSCIGGSVSTTVQVIRSGSALHSSPSKLTLSSHQSEGKRRIQISLNDNPDTTVFYPQKAIRTDTANGCTHATGGTRTSSTDSGKRISMSNLRVLVDADDIYPEVISGSKEVEEHDGSVTHWEWNFTRLDPSEHPTYVDAVGG